jgi:hypothetical protein
LLLARGKLTVGQQLLALPAEYWGKANSARKANLIQKEISAISKCFDDATFPRILATLILPLPRIVRA